MARIVFGSEEARRIAELVKIESREDKDISIEDRAVLVRAKADSNRDHLAPLVIVLEEPSYHAFLTLGGTTYHGRSSTSELDAREKVLTCWANSQVALVHNHDDDEAGC